jgi:membrane protein YqaA with SNARE-associated domain
MPEQVTEEQEICETTKATDEIKQKKSSRRSYALGIIGVILTIAMFVAIIYYGDAVRDMAQYGYIGAFLISILGGATIIIPVPMLAVVFALGSAMGDPWQVALVGFSAALGESIGALTIYMTGHGAGRVISGNKRGKSQRVYERMLDIIERRGAWALFAVTSVINPFFYPAAFACGALRFGLKKYLVIVFFGKIIKCMTIVYAGYFGLKNIFRALGIEI